MAAFGYLSWNFLIASVGLNARLVRDLFDAVDFVVELFELELTLDWLLVDC